MKIIRLLLTCLLPALLGSCASGNPLGRLLSTPFNLLNGMTKTLGRTIGTVSQAEPPAVDTDAALVADRGAMVGGKGTYLGRDAADLHEAGTGVARR